MGGASSARRSQLCFSGTGGGRKDPQGPKALKPPRCLGLLCPLHFRVARGSQVCHRDGGGDRGSKAAAMSVITYAALVPKRIGQIK